MKINKFKYKNLLFSLCALFALILTSCEIHLHTFLNPTYYWNDDYSVCVGEATCECGLVLEETSESSFDGEYYIAEFTSKCFTTQKVKKEVPHEHEYVSSYTWNNDNTSCTARAECSCGDIIIETVNSNIEDSYYVTKFTNSLFETQYKEISHSHNYGEPIYTWDEKNEYCTARAYCVCGEYMEEVVKVEVIDNQYVASFTCKKFYTQYKDVPKDKPEIYGYDFYDGYYGELSWNNSLDLKQKLNDIISKNTYKAMAYEGNWESNQFADQAIDDFESVDIIYAPENNLKTFTAGANQLGWNREHAFCASLMTGSTSGNAVKTRGRATDFQNLFASQQAGNQSRGNKNYGYADKNSASYKNNTVNNGYDGYSFDNKNFEPADVDKGRVARAIFYMGIMYNEEVYDSRNEKTMKALSVVDEYVDYNASTYDAFAHGNKQDLLQWNKFPVDRLEYQHNESVYSHTYSNDSFSQGNRNPFVDYPELVDYVYGNKANEAGDLKYLEPSVSSLDILDTDKIANYAIKSAKREYFVGDTVNIDDLEIVKVFNDFRYETVSEDISIASYTFTEQDASRGSKRLSITTPLNTINYDVKVTAGNIEKCNYVYTLDASCNLLSAYKNNGLNVQNGISLNNVNWNVSWTATNNIKSASTKGMQFGASTGVAAPIVFESSSSFTYEGKSDIYAIYIKCNTASGATYPITVKIGDTTVYSGTAKYDTTFTKDVYGVDLTTPLSGVISITLGQPSKNSAMYVNKIAVLTK